MNRRGNGLDAEIYAPLVDLAPHLADAMLTALREAGVAAYALPTTDETTQPPFAAAVAEGRVDGSGADALDRLYVDQAMKPTAEGVLQLHLSLLRDTGGPVVEPDTGPDGADHPDTAKRPLGDTGTGTAERDEDAIWAEIVASFDSEPAADAGPWPDQENIDEPDSDDAEGKDGTGRLPTARVVSAADLSGAADEPLPADDEGHYVPPPPPPLPNAEPITKAAWIALVGGPLYLLLTVILGWEVPGWAAFLAVAAFIGGFVTLVLRMGDDPRDPDDGAVV